MATEKDLFLLIKNSNEQAFELLFRLYFQPLQTFAAKIVDDGAIAEGIVQEVFIQLWEHRRRLENTAPKAYLYRMTKNRALNHIRHIQVKSRYAEEVQHTIKEWEDDEEMLHEDVMVKIYNSIDKLPSQCRNVFIMSRMNGIKQKEIAEELGISIKTVKNHVGKALKILRDDLKGLDMVLVIGLIELFSKKM